MRTVLVAAALTAFHAGALCQTGAPGVSFEQTGTPNGRQTFGIAALPDGTVYAADMQGLLRSSPDLSTWTETLAGYARALAVGPARELYAATPDSVVKTTDEGRSWLVLRTGAPNEFFSLAVSPAGAVFLGDRYGVLSSARGDTAWRRVLNTGPVSSLLSVPASGDLFAFEDSLIHRSTDGGSSWTAHRLDSLDLFVYALAADSAGNLFAGTSTHGLYRSTDRGESWYRLVNALSTLDVVALAADSAGRLYAGLRSGLMYSDDHGESWTLLNPSANVPQVYDIAVASTGRLLAATAFGLLSSPDRGLTWQMLAPRPGVDRIYQLALSPGDWLYALTSAGVHRSRNGGNSWTPANAGFCAFIPSYLAVDAGGRLFGGAGGDNFRSTDHGSSWQRISLGREADSAGVNDMLAAPSGRLLAATKAGIFASGDQGLSWSRLDSGLTNAARLLALSPDGTLYAGCLGSGISDLIPPTPAGTVFSSSDSGNHWKELSAWTLSGDRVEVTSFAFADSGTVLAGTSLGSIYRSTDHGLTWSEHPVGTQVNTMAIDSQRFCYAGGYSSLYRSTDQGRSWSPYGPGLGYLPDPVVSIVVDSAGTVLFASGNRIYRSVATVTVGERLPLPVRYELYQNYPNPFNPATVIRYDLPQESALSLKVFNALGQEVLLLAEGRKPAGSYTAVFDGRNLPSGVYFCRLTAGPYSATRKIMLVK